MHTIAPQFAPLLWLIPALPLVGFIVNGLMALAASGSAQGPDRKISGGIAVLMPLLSCAITLAGIYQLWAVGADGAPVVASPTIHAAGWTWLQFGDVAVQFGLQFDRLSAFMLLFITGIGSLIVLYSTGYMAADRGYARFMAYMNLFLFSMIMLVLGDNLLVTFLGWEGVGLCSYLLIGFWHKDHANNDAARKAFVVNRVGDLGFIIGTFALLWIMGENASLNYAEISAYFGGMEAGAVPGLLTAATLFFFFGCTGKSAQIPLLTWLPDAMAGPTPVSALIHAATMVTSGVFLLARLGDVLALTPATLWVIGVLAAATALWAAIAGLVQWDIKKALAYSTISQLGYMFLACSVGAYDAALFHVFTHAFFKAALFLGAGSVIHALHHEQDMRRMGGLAKRLPHTHGAMLLAWWSIIGAPLGAAFFSKDIILEHLALGGGAYWLLWLVGLGTAVITAIYMTRLMAYTFWSPSRLAHPDEVREPSLVMLVPVQILAVGALAAGTMWVPFVGEMDHVRWWLQPVLASAQDQAPWQELGAAAAEAHAGNDAAVASHAGHTVLIILLTLASVAAAVIGAGYAWFRFKRGPQVGKGSGELPPLGGFAAGWTWAFDRVYRGVVVLPVQALGWILDRLVDQTMLRPVLGWVADSTNYLGCAYRSLQRSRLRTSLCLSTVGAVTILLIVVVDLLAGS